MRIVGASENITWAPCPNTCEMVVDSRLPSRALISTAFVLAFADDDLLLVNVASRGWDIPGGHCEDQESPEETMRREVYEEAGARLGDISLFGYQRIRIFGKKPDGYQYPYPESYQVFYRASVAELDPFVPTAEVIGRALLSSEEARKTLQGRGYYPLYDAACGTVRSQFDANHHRR